MDGSGSNCHKHPFTYTDFFLNEMLRWLFSIHANCTWHNCFLFQHVALALPLTLGISSCMEGGRLLVNSEVF